MFILTRDYCIREAIGLSLRLRWRGGLLTGGTVSGHFGSPHTARPASQTPQRTPRPLLDTTRLVTILVVLAGPAARAELEARAATLPDRTDWACGAWRGGAGVGRVAPRGTQCRMAHDQAAGLLRAAAALQQPPQQ